MTDGDLSTAIIGLLMALWLVAATVAVWHGLSLRRQSLKILRQTSRLARLLETGPAVPVIVRGDGRIEASERFFRLLGLSQVAGSLTDLYASDDSGIAAPDLATLEAHVREVQRTAASFSQALRIAHSDRRLLVVGAIADAAIYPNGAALLWFFDLTENLREWDNVKQEAEEARAAFSAISALIEASPLPMWHRRKDLRINFVNRAYVQAVGVENAETAVEQGVELIEPVDGATAMSFAERALTDGTTQERTVSSTIGGNRRQMRVFDVPLGDAGVGGLAIDIQDLSDAERQYSRLSNAQRDLLDMMSAAVAQFDADRSLSFANLPFRRLFAFRDSWLTEKPEFARVVDRMRENSKIPEVRNFPEWRAERENWFLAANPSEENWLLPDGTHLRVLAQPMPSGGLLMIFEDRTEQAQLASARDTLLRVRTATFDNLFESVAVFAGDSRLSIWNRRFADIWQLEEAALAGHPRLDELLPLLARHLKKPSQIAVVAEILRMTTANREARKSRINFADGRIFQISTVPLPDGNALFTMFDMTDSIQIEQALRDRNSALLEADAMKGKFLANMSYEFRTPLTSISGFADLMKSGIAGKLPPKAMEYVEAIAASSERLTQQINTVLDYSQGEVGALPITKLPVDVASLLRASITEHRKFASDRQIEIILDAGSKPGIIAGDQKRLSQAIGHIVDNALRYGRQGGRVLIVTQAEKNGVTIIISDDGPGMSSKDQAAVFDGFRAAPTSQASAPAGEAGTARNGGLGLPLARQLVEAHGGRLELQSEIDVGTNLVIWLPRK